jgi:pimeloyl-ACP methyl ester carboxylesterase
MRAREPDADGYVDRGGVKLHWEAFGEGEPTLLLPPAWTVVHSRFWKAQVPYLARHFRVVTYDGPGNGRSDRPLASAPYGYEAEGQAAVAVLDATGTGQAVLVPLSMGLETTPEVLIAMGRAPVPDEATLRGRCEPARVPKLVIHGDEDEISPLHAGETLAEATGGALVVLEGTGHIPLARDPVKVNLLVREFVERLSSGRRP